MFNLREIAVKRHFIDTFTASLKKLYELCEKESSLLNRAHDFVNIGFMMGAGYWGLRNIADIHTPYGNVSFNPLACVVAVGALAARRAHENAERSARVVNFFGSQEMCETLVESVAEGLYDRFEFSIQLLADNGKGVKCLANFFVDAIAHGLSRIEHHDDVSSKHKQLVKLAIPERGDSVYFSHCIQKKAKLKNRMYPLPEDGSYQAKYRRYFSIMDLLTRSPAVVNESLCVQDGNAYGHKIYPPQRLRESDHEFHAPLFNFNEQRYHSLISIFNDPEISHASKTSSLKNTHHSVTGNSLLTGANRLAEQTKREVLKENFYDQYRHRYPVSSFFHIPKYVGGQVVDARTCGANL